MTSRGGVWLGDLARAVGALAATDDTARAIAALLGTAPDTAPVRVDVTRPVPPSLPPHPASRTASRSQPARGAAAGRIPPADPAAPPAVPIVEPARPARPPQRLPPLAEVLDAAPERPLPAADLLAPARRRAMLTALCSVAAESGEIDVPATVERMARGEPLGPLPVLVRPTTRRGVTVLLDRGPAMTPFARDQDDLLDGIRTLVESDVLDVVSFAGTPLAGAGSGPVWTWRPFRPRPDGRPLLVVTDLGSLAHPADRTQLQRSWLRFAAAVHESGCPLVALTPVPHRRLPRPLRLAVATVVWDRGTPVRDAARAVRRAGGRVQRRTVR